MSDWFVQSVRKRLAAKRLCGSKRDPSAPSVHSGRASLRDARFVQSVRKSKKIQGLWRLEVRDKRFDERKPRQWIPIGTSVVAGAEWVPLSSGRKECASGRKERSCELPSGKRVRSLLKRKELVTRSKMWTWRKRRARFAWEVCRGERGEAWRAIISGQRGY